MLIQIKRILNKFGIDGAVAFTILSRVVQAGGGVISIVFIAKYLSGIEQGYYYTFASIIAIQIFFELGLSNIITQYTAHEFAFLRWDDNFKLEGDEYHKSRISSLLRFCVKWFGIVSIILLFVLIAAGFCFFIKYSKAENGIVQWQSPWIILCLSTSLNLFIDPLLAFFEGLGYVKDMAKVRLKQKSFYIIFLFCFFSLGFKLYSSALASLFAIGINYIQIIFSFRIKYLKSVWAAKSKWDINYKSEIFPYQWRIAISWISGYFIFQLFNPILFATEGPLVAGQMGMTIAALSGVASISMSWINTKVPLLSGLIAKKQYQELDFSFKKAFKQSMGIQILIILFFVLCVEFLKYMRFPVGNRFLAFVPLVCMSIASVINQVIYALATYLRCHKKEPLLLNSVFVGVIVCISTVVFGKLYGVLGITVGFNAIICFISFPWVCWIFFKKRKEWHLI